MNVAGRFLGSMAGRIFVISLVGAIASATLALGMAGIKRAIEYRHMKLEQVTERVQDYADLLRHAPPGAVQDLIRDGVPKLRPASATARGNGIDPILTDMLSRRLGPQAEAKAEPASARYCVRRPALNYETPLDSAYEKEVSCWLIQLKLNGAPLRLIYLEQKGADPAPLAWDPLFFCVLAVGVGVGAAMAARVAAAPLHQLSRAASALAGNLDERPLPEQGPHEVRSAAQAFNAMQTVLKRHIKERHQMLGSITHDLQTPLTRLRLRVEKVPDGDLKDRMIADLAAMQQLIREGLELARGDDAGETPVRIDLDSLLQSLAADAVDAGGAATVGSDCGCIMLAQPQSLKRALNNLVQNAVRYAGGAEIEAVLDSDRLAITVADRGPGIREDQLETVMEPFVRLESSRSRETGGVGLGLTIARRLAERNGGVLTLANRPSGGLVATVSFPRDVVVSVRSTSRVSHGMAAVD